MAIDSQNKRRSVQAYTFGLVRPLADGTIAADDRAVAAWLYSRESARRRFRTRTGGQRSFTRSNVQDSYIERL